MNIRFILCTILSLPATTLFSMESFSCSDPNNNNSQRVQGVTTSQLDENIAQFYLDTVIAKDIKEQLSAAVNQNSQSKNRIILLTGDPETTKNSALALAYFLKKPYLMVTPNSCQPNNLEATKLKIKQLGNTTSPAIAIVHCLADVNTKYNENKDNEPRPNSQNKGKALLIGLTQLQQHHLVIATQKKPKEVPQSLKKLFIDTSVLIFPINKLPNQMVTEHVWSWAAKNKINGCFKRTDSSFGNQYKSIALSVDGMAITEISSLISRELNLDSDTEEEESDEDEEEEKADKKSDDEEFESEEEELPNSTKQEKSKYSLKEQARKKINFVMGQLKPTTCTLYTIDYSEKKETNPLLKLRIKKDRSTLALKEEVVSGSGQISNYKVETSTTGHYLDLEQVRAAVQKYDKRCKELDYTPSSDEEENAENCCICMTEMGTGIQAVRHLPCCEQQIHLQCLLENAEGNDTVQCPLCRDYAIDIPTWTAFEYVAPEVKSKKTKKKLAE